ncbi:hypothetical protein B6U99_01965 [Candidatus Geothermarchaeota archaeon ex4572_27]|nr:MAG: hypothetical protein B6U99_01965 [Candidatus Geothermarchaeota archaeon ex4572_27]
MPSGEDRLREEIPGYLGYRDKRFRASTDRAFREYAAEEIHKLLDAIRRAVVFSPTPPTGDRMMVIEQILFKADDCRRKLLDETRVPKDLGQREMTDDEIERLVAVEAKIVDMVKKLQELADRVAASGLSRPEVIMVLKMISEGLDALRGKVVERLEALKGSHEGARLNP